MKSEKQSDTSGKKPFVDPTDPRQAAVFSGGLTGAVAGAVVGSMAGPVGTVVGTAAGTIIGAKTAEDISIDTSAEEHYWAKNWKSMPYIEEARSYDDYAPAFRAGYSLPDEVYQDEEVTFDEAEENLRRHYEADAAKTLRWEAARPAAHDAFNRVIDDRNRRRRFHEDADLAPAGTSLDPTKPGIS